jgi:predicted dehydrogenase
MDKINVSLSGFGTIGKYHTLAYKCLPLCHEDIGCSINLYKLLTSKSLDKHITGFQIHTDNIEDLYDTDMLDICSPNFVHKEQIEKAVGMGIKNIYCEKPLSGISDEEKYLVQLANDNKITNQVALMMRFYPAVSRTKRLIEDGVIGKVINFNCHMYHQSYLDPKRPISWRLRKDKSSGGALVDLGIHMIDLVRYILGDIVETRAITSTVIKKRPCKEGYMDVDVDDFAHLDLVLKPGITGTLEVSRMAAGHGDDIIFQVFGTEGSITVDGKDFEWPVVYLLKDNTWLKGDFKKYFDVEDDIALLMPPSKFSLGWMMNAHMASIYSFILKLQGRKLKYITPACFEDSYQSSLILKAAYESAENGGKAVKII